MAGGAFIIEHSSLAPSLCDLGSLRICRRSDWKTIFPDQLQFLGESLLVANAVPGTEEVMRFFRWLHEHPLPVPTLAILPDEDSELLHVASEVVDDFLLHPVRGEEFRRRVARLLGPQPHTAEAARASLITELSLRQIVGTAPAFLRVLTQATLFGASGAPVLLSGETGTGKELCARVIHLMGKRRDGPFIPVECGAIPEHLFENELFGHARGAFTDAHMEQKGLVALAQGGTLFLDEIDGLSLAAQGKILRLLQEKTYRPLGSEHFRTSNLRVIAATNRNLEELIRKKHFREDLFFRLNVLRLHLPPLRQRPEDIAPLARHFLEESGAAENIPKKLLSPAAIRKLEAYDWPGNVRELANTVQRAVFCAPGTQIASAHVSFCSTEAGTETPLANFRRAKVLAIEKFEREYVEQLLEKHAGNVTYAARDAGKDRRAFGRLIKKYHLR